MSIGKFTLSHIYTHLNIYEFMPIKTINGFYIDLCERIISHKPIYIYIMTKLVHLSQVVTLRIQTNY